MNVCCCSSSSSSVKLPKAKRIQPPIYDGQSQSGKYKETIEKKGTTFAQ